MFWCQLSGRQLVCAQTQARVQEANQEHEKAGHHTSSSRIERSVGVRWQEPVRARDTGNDVVLTSRKEGKRHRIQTQGAMLTCENTLLMSLTTTITHSISLKNTKVTVNHLCGVAQSPKQRAQHLNLA